MSDRYPPRPVRATLAQLDPTIGDLDHNAEQILAAIERASHDGADLVVTPELALLGYPPRDLLLREGVVERSWIAMERIARLCTRTTALVGLPVRAEGSSRPLRNGVAVCRHGRIEAVYAKRLLPTYDVFDEDRYFSPGDRPLVVEVAGERVGVLVCEDCWQSDDVGGLRHYASDPVADSLAAGATTLAVLSASPYTRGKDRRHAARLASIARRGVALVAVNQVGGNDDLVFDGRSRAFAADGTPLAELAAFENEVRTVDLRGTLRQPATHAMGEEEEVVRALVAGIRDYLRKTGHREALLGISGGIDSALVATLASIAIGAERVTGVLLPSRHSSQHSIDDALDLAGRLGLKAAPSVPIERAHAALQATLGEALPPLGGRCDGLVDENLQSRIRGVLLMALSNATGAIVLSTGNKSEMAAGYATLYGDMNGGLAPLGDVPKLLVYAASRHLNAHFDRYGFASPPIPERSIEKAPSAELKPDQTDQDTLPPYAVLDAIVEGWIDRQESAEAIATRTGIDLELVRRWAATIDRMQYKRDQAAVVLKVSPRTFGRGRPMPIASRWKP